MSNENTRTVLKFIDAMSAADVENADACVGPDAFTVTKGFGKFSGVRKREAMVGMIRAFEVLFPDGLNPEVKSITAQDDRVVVEFEGNAITGEGKSYHNQYCMVFFLKDGLINQLNEYFCNIHSDEVLWSMVEKMGVENCD